MARVPIRWKLTLGFAAATAVLLAALGLFVYQSFKSQLDEQVLTSLESQAQDVKAVLAGGDNGAEGLSTILAGDDTVGEVLSADGRVLHAPPQLGGEALISARQAGDAAQDRVRVDAPSVSGLTGRVRLLAVPGDTANGKRVVVVAGASLEDRDAALSSLRRILFVGGPVALAIASLIGYVVAGSALRPVERMRRRAATISAGGPSERLPVPEADDEIARLGETLNAMLGRLETAIERERRFVDDASHELRTPLAMQKAELELALRYGKDAAELRAAIASAAVEADRLNQLAEDLLVLARSDKGRLAVKLEPVDLADVLDAVRRRFEPRAAESGRSILVEDGARLSVSADRLRLDQALTNLVENAFRHGEGTVTLRAEQAGDEVRIHVLDDGPGFPPELAATAFGRFTRGDAARTGAGAGLGLAIVAAIADAHGGRAEVAPRSDGGADLVIHLPFTGLSSAANTTAPDNESPPSGA